MLLTRPLAVASLAVCAAGLCWGVLAVDRRTGGAAHVRLVVAAVRLPAVVRRSPGAVTRLDAGCAS